MMHHDIQKDVATPRPLVSLREARRRDWRGEPWGGTAMQRPAREDRGTPCYFEVVRVKVSCPATEAHTRALILEHATIYADGWASWVEEGHARFGYVQAGPCCHRPEAHTLEAGTASE
jgi:hypothetical protein